VELELNVKHHFTVDFGKASAQFTNDVASAVGVETEDAINRSVDDLATAIVKRVKPAIADAIRRQNNSGRQGAG
jgi:hypothetical protein